ncbi:hypothetical protein ACFSO7_12490 [Bacillus sp. CGMCC 1.16607]|uniref:HAAS signaling domain-containing protein n=1 Tax=Bacillus sp. CGMCC 1.16607 TaxID=3351842 RepID=UPI00363D4A85
MNLIELYIQEVTRRLPEKNRADIALELRSTIEDMLPDEFSEEDVKVVLTKLGNPAILASGYRDRPMHLIGPCYYDVYINLLKMILPIATIISLISLIAENIVSYEGEALLNVILHSFGEGIWRILSTGIQVFFWLTVVFAILERVNPTKNPLPLTFSLEEWKPEDLKTIPYIPKGKVIPKFEVFGGLFWTAIWATVYFNASKLLGVYEKGKEGLVFVTPTFNHEVLLSYWPLVVLCIGLEVTLAISKGITGQWTKKVAVINGIFHFVSSIVFIIIFSNPNLINDSFIIYINELFNINYNWSNQAYLAIVLIFVLFAVIDMYQGYKKSKI